MLCYHQIEGFEEITKKESRLMTNYRNLIDKYDILITFVWKGLNRCKGNRSFMYQLLCFRSLLFFSIYIKKKNGLERRIDIVRCDD